MPAERSVLISFLQGFAMEVFALLFASKYGMAAFGSVTVAVVILLGMLSSLAYKANQRPGAAIKADRSST
jgi:hypothetical protein